MKDLRARWVFTVGILYLLPEGRRSCKKWVGSGKILVAVFLTCTIAPDWYQIAILQEIVYILFSFSLFLTERFPHQQTRPNVITLFTNESWNTNEMFLAMCKASNFLRKYNLCWPFLYRFIVLSSHLSLSSIVVPRYLFIGMHNFYVLPIGVDRGGVMYT